MKTTAFVEIYNGEDIKIFFFGKEYEKYSELIKNIKPKEVFLFFQKYGFNLKSCQIDKSTKIYIFEKKWFLRNFFNNS